jgi:hypothetical protein
MHRETSEAIQARLDRQPRSDERRELQQAAAVIARRLAELDDMDRAVHTTVARFGSR